MECQNCFNINPDNSNFCTYCGTWLGIESIPLLTEVENDKESKSGSTREMGENGVFIIGLILLGTSIISRFAEVSFIILMQMVVPSLVALLCAFFEKRQKQRKILFAIAAVFIAYSLYRHFIHFQIY